MRPIHRCNSAPGSPAALCSAVAAPHDPMPQARAGVLMMVLLTALGLCASAASAASAAVPNRDGNNPQQGYGRPDGAGGSQEGQRPRSASDGTGEQRFRGKLLSLRAIDLHGPGDKHVIAKVLTDSGRTILADLGTVREFRRANLRRGQQVEAAGRAGRINNAPVLLVMRLRADGQDVRLDRGNGQQGPRRQQVQVVKGTITDTRDVSLKGVSDKHTLVKIRTRDGRALVVDLGKQQGVQGLTPRKGAFIAARGQTGRINGKSVLFARQFSDGERVLNADRSGARPARPGDPSRGRQQMVIGTVTDTRGVSLKGVADRHALLKVKTPDGRTVVLDLGAEDASKSLGLKKGQTVAARGPLGRINGRPVLFARQVAPVMTITRTPAPQQGSEPTAQQAAAEVPAPSGAAGTPPESDKKGQEKQGPAKPADDTASPPDKEATPANRQKQQGPIQ